MVISFTCPDGAAVIYPRSQLVSFQGRMYRITVNIEMLLLSFQLHNPPAVSIKLNGRYWTDRGLKYGYFLHIITECRTGEQAYAPTWCMASELWHDKNFHNGIFIDTINSKWRRLQRWMLITARKLITRRKLTLAMALHDRLGANCKMAIVGTDCIKLIADMLSGSALSRTYSIPNQLQTQSTLPYNYYPEQNQLS